MQEHIERREFPRTKARIPVKIESDIICETSDISESGLGFLSERPISLSTTKAMLEISNTTHIRCNISIIWNTKFTENHKFRYGAHFDNISQDDTDCLRNFFVENTISQFLDRIEDKKNKDSFKNFFLDDVKRYISNVTDISCQIKNGRISDKKAADEFFKSTHEVLEKAEALGLAFQQKLAIKRAKELFRSIISHWIYKGKIVERAFRKPRGYPGDYLTLEQLYNNKPDSGGIGYYSDLYFLANEYAVAVRNRKEEIKKLIRSFIDTKGAPSLKILNIACGPCREIREIFTDKKSLHAREIVLNLLDHDEEALEFSRRTILPIDGLKLNLIKENVMDLGKDKSYLEKLKDQDLIYSLGLCDYLPDRVLKQLIGFCIKVLSKDGILILTHKDVNRCRPVAPDWFCDWKFYSRTEKDFVDLILSAADNSISIKDVVRETSGRIIFVLIQK